MTIKTVARGQSDLDRNMETRFNMIVYCPFCLYEGELHKYGLKTRDGFNKGLFKCPDCGQRMRKDTLLNNMTTDVYARWLYQNIIESMRYKTHKDEKKFYNRISWDKLKERLKYYGRANKFWDAFKDEQAKRKLAVYHRDGKQQYIMGYLNIGYKNIEKKLDEFINDMNK